MGADERRVSYTERVRILVLPQQADHSLLTEHCELGMEAFIPVIPALDSLRPAGAAWQDPVSRKHTNNNNNCRTQRKTGVNVCCCHGCS